MNCDQFDHLMQHLLDGHRSPERDPLLLDHVRSCGSCRSILEVQTKLFQELRGDLSRFAPVPRSLAAHSKHDARRRRAPLETTKTWCAIACGLGLAIGAWSLLTWKQDFPASSKRVAVRPETTSQNPYPKKTGTGTTDQLPLTSTNHVAAASGNSYAGPLLTPLLESVGEHLSRTPTDGGQSIQSIAGGLRPVTNSFSAAVQVLRKTLRSNREPREAKPQAGLAGFAQPLV